MKRELKLLRTGKQNLTDLVRKDFTEKVTINYELKNESKKKELKQPADNFIKPLTEKKRRAWSKHKAKWSK